MKAYEKRRILFYMVGIGILCLIIVVLNAYSTDLRYRNNDLLETNKALRGEVDTLSIQIESANNIEHIEKFASEKLGMVYPGEGECIYLIHEDKPDANFAMLIRERAYN